jgi:hypothetical protein
VLDPSPEIRLLRLHATPAGVDDPVEIELWG